LSRKNSAVVQLRPVGDRADGILHTSGRALKPKVGQVGLSSEATEDLSHHQDKLGASLRHGGAKAKADVGGPRLPGSKIEAQAGVKARAYDPQSGVQVDAQHDSQVGARHGTQYGSQQHGTQVATHDMTQIGSQYSTQVGSHSSIQSVLKAEHSQEFPGEAKSGVGLLGESLGGLQHKPRDPVNIAKNKSDFGLKVKAQVAGADDRSRSLKKTREEEQGVNPQKTGSMASKAEQQAKHRKSPSMASETEHQVRYGMSPASIATKSIGPASSSLNYEEKLTPAQAKLKSAGSEQGNEGLYHYGSPAPKLSSAGSNITSPAYGTKHSTAEMFNPSSSDVYVERRPIKHKPPPKQKKIYLPAMKPNLVMINQVKNAYGVVLSRPLKKAVKLPSIRRSESPAQSS
jgi:hypothetical protein